MSPVAGRNFRVWTNLLTKETLTGPAWADQTHGFDTLPPLVRRDSVLPLGASEDGPEYDWADGVHLGLHELTALVGRTPRARRGPVTRRDPRQYVRSESFSTTCSPRHPAPTASRTRQSCRATFPAAAT